MNKEHLLSPEVLAAAFQNLHRQIRQEIDAAENGIADDYVAVAGYFIEQQLNEIAGDDKPRDTALLGRISQTLKRIEVRQQQVATLNQRLFTLEQVQKSPGRLKDAIRDYRVTPA